MSRTVENTADQFDISLDPKHRSVCILCKVKYNTRRLVKRAVSNFYFNVDNSQETIKINK